MSIVRGLALAHLSATAVLLLLFVGLISAQRLVAAVRAARSAGTPVAYPSTGERSAIPAQEASPAGRSVLDWHVDLRDEERSAGSRQLQRSS